MRLGSNGTNGKGWFCTNLKRLKYNDQTYDESKIQEVLKPIREEGDEFNDYYEIMREENKCKNNGS